jgi:CRISPR-associated helicase Cas3
MRIQSYSLSRVRHPYYEQRKGAHPDCEAARSGWHPYIHQAVLLDAWNQHDAFLLTTKTGSGKTQAAALPVIANGESAFFVYPTNALVEDQQRSILKLAEGLGWRPYIYQAGEEFDKLAFNRADVLLVRVDADNLEHMRHLSRHRTKGQTLLDILNLGGPTIVLTNPDTLFLILALRYSEGMSIFATLSQYHTLVVDEFHLYGGVELAHLLFMLHYCRANGFFGGRTVLLSATPDENVDELLEAVIAPYRVRVDSPTPHPSVDEYPVAHPIELVSIPPGDEPVEAALSQFEQLRPELEHLFIEKSADDYVPLVIIFNSVMAAMYAADLLREKHSVPSEQIGEYRGLMDRRLRSFKDKLVVVGTSAIEVGVDFKCRYLVFEAGDAASFMQRFGRVGRHEEGTAYLLAPPNVLRDAPTVTKPLTRDELESKVRLWYAQNDARPWFVRTESGVLSITLLAHRLVEEVTADRSATPNIVQQARENVDVTLGSYVSRIGAVQAYMQVRKWLKLYSRNPDALPWLQAYAARMAFRTSSISFRVHDIREEKRRSTDTVRQGGYYDADLRTLLRRGKNPTLKRGKRGEYVTIYGYTKAGRVEAHVQIGKLGQIYTTYEMRDKHKEYVLLTREGKTSRLSDKVMEQDHIFVVVSDSISAYVDWRIATFCHPQGLLAFDGDALLLKEIYERTRRLF